MSALKGDSISVREKIKQTVWDNLSPENREIRKITNVIKYMIFTNSQNMLFFEVHTFVHPYLI